jgi:hypothetical protein
MLTMDCMRWAWQLTVHPFPRLQPQLMRWPKSQLEMQISSQRLANLIEYFPGAGRLVYLGVQSSGDTVPFLGRGGNWRHLKQNRLYCFPCMDFIRDCMQSTVLA